MCPNTTCAAAIVAVPTRQSFDVEYVRRLTRGDPEIEHHFVAYFGALLWVKLRSRVRSPELIRDVRQETFLRVLTALRQKGGLEHPERLGAFVNGVCNNVLLEVYRCEARFDAAHEAAADLPDESRDPEMSVLVEDQNDHVRKALTSLPARDREVLRMIFMEEADRAQVCRRMRIGEGYLRVLLHRAKGRLKARLMQRFPERYGTTAIPSQASA